MKAETDSEYSAAVKPILDAPDSETLGDIHRLCSGTSAYPTASLFVCLCLLLFCPESLFGGKLPNSLATAIGDELGISRNSISIWRNKVASWLKIYEGFASEVAGLFDAFLSK